MKQLEKDEEKDVNEKEEKIVKDDQNVKKEEK